jgi:hypothetical protein
MQRVALGSLVVAVIAAAGVAAWGQNARSQFVGVYTLAEYAPHGDEPTGRISYDAAGRMWAMLMPPGREPLTNASSPEEYQATMRGVVAYYGTYDVDESTGRVIHHVEAASNPDWIGDDFIRWYRFEGQDLRLSLNPEFTGTLFWARLPDVATD